ncbi:YciI family protein [Leuconostoc sp. JNUCC 76]
MKFIEYAIPNVGKIKQHDVNINEVVKQHVTYLEQKNAEGLLVFAGTTTDGTGGLIVYDVSDEATRDRVVQEDPLYLSESMDITIHPFETFENITS